MFITSSQHPPASHLQVEQLQLVDAALCAAELGEVSAVHLAAGSSHRLQAGEYEAVSIIVAGRAETANGVALPTGSGIIARAGGEFTLKTSDVPARILTMEGLGSRVALDGLVRQPDTRAFHVDDVADRSSHNPARGFHHMQARLLLDTAAGGWGSLLMGLGTFAPGGGCHDLHRHPNAEEFFYVWQGGGVHLGPDGSPHPVGAGDLVYVRRGEGHGFRNTTDRPALAIFGYFGVGSLGEAGYELPDPVANYPSS